MFEFFTWLKLFPDFVQQICSKGAAFAASTIIAAIRYWYYVMIIPAIWAVYYLLAALNSSGITDKFSAIVQNTLATVHAITIDCFPLIANLRDMLNCIDAA